MSEERSVGEDPEGGFEPDYVEVPVPPPTGPPVDDVVPPTSGKSGCSKWLLWLLIIAALIFGISKCGDSEAITLSTEPAARESQQVSVTSHFVDTHDQSVVSHDVE